MMWDFLENSTCLSAINNGATLAIKPAVHIKRKPFAISVYRLDCDSYYHRWLSITASRASTSIRISPWRPKQRSLPRPSLRQRLKLSSKRSLPTAESACLRPITLRLDHIQRPMECSRPTRGILQHFLSSSIFTSCTMVLSPCLSTHVQTNQNWRTTQSMRSGLEIKSCSKWSFLNRLVVYND